MKFGEYLMEMSNLSKKATGLDNIIWVMYKTGKEKHGPRIKVKHENKFIPIKINDNPEVAISIKKPIKNIKNIFNWIKLNKIELIKYWNAQGEIGIDELLQKLKKE
jgi:hypothetical protein